MNMKHTIFSVEVFDLTLDVDDATTNAAISEAIGLRAAYDGKANSNKGGFQSQYDVATHDDTAMASIIEKIGTAATEEYGFPLKVSTAWANVNEFGNWNMPHNHHPRDFVAVYFLQSDLEPDLIMSEKDGHIILLDVVPNLNCPGRMDNVCTFSPKAGRLIMFPGYITHMVAPHFSNDPRISIAVNLDGVT